VPKASEQMPDESIDNVTIRDNLGRHRKLEEITGNEETSLELPQVGRRSLQEKGVF